MIGILSNRCRRGRVADSTSCDTRPIFATPAASDRTARALPAVPTVMLAPLEPGRNRALGSDQGTTAPCPTGERFSTVRTAAAAGTIRRVRSYGRRSGFHQDLRGSWLRSAFLFARPAAGRRPLALRARPGHRYALQASSISIDRNKRKALSPRMQSSPSPIISSSRGPASLLRSGTPSGDR